MFCHMVRSVCWMGLLLLAVFGCSSSGEPSPQIGSVKLSIAETPPDAACLRLTARGLAQVVRPFELQSGRDTFVLNELPLGEVEFSGEAFAAPCSLVFAETAPPDVSDPVVVELVEGQTAELTLELRRTGSAVVSIAFGSGVPECNGTSGQWQGCRGNGCFVCSDLLADFPLYLQNHPDCISNDTCDGLYFTCNEKCPHPTDDDRG